MSSSSKERSLESIRRRKNVKRDKNGPFQFASSSSNEIIGTGGLPPSVTKPKLWAGIPSLPSHALDLQNIKLPKCAPGALLPDFRSACSIRLFFYPLFVATRRRRCLLSKLLRSEGARATGDDLGLDRCGKKARSFSTLDKG